MVQEYGRYFGMKTGVLPRRLPDRARRIPGAELHGFLAVSGRSAPSTGTPYTVFGYKGKQVRDNIHCDDLVQRVLAVLRGAAARRGLQHRRRPLRQLLDARGDRDRRADHRPADGVDVRRHESHRRSHLVDQRHPQVRWRTIRAGASRARSRRRSPRSSTRSESGCGSAGRSPDARRVGRRGRAGDAVGRDSRAQRRGAHRDHGARPRAGAHDRPHQARDRRRQRQQSGRHGRRARSGSPPSCRTCDRSTTRRRTATATPSGSGSRRSRATRSSSSWPTARTIPTTS